MATNTVGEGMRTLKAVILEYWASVMAGRKRRRPEAPATSSAPASS